MPVFTLRVWAMVKLFDIIQNPFLQVLRVESMPKMLRSCVVRNLESFKGLKILGLQAGNSLTPYICRGIVNMQSLVSFSLKYNFTDEMLSALLACKSTLKVLDIENSRQITDLSVPSILEFSGLEELSISRTGISEEGQAHILINLHNIVRLPRGDYLCEALDWIAWELKPRPQPIFKIRNFWSSEVYYFHSLDQIQLVLEMCPYIQDMLFMFQDRYTCPLSVLGSFNCLTDLELWGGDFYSDDMENVLQQIGSNLTKLDLHHFESLDSQAIALISFYCTSLQHLGFSGCGFIEPRTVSEEFHQTDRW
ncbi:uncharacterized protein LOC111701049 [Eurytemora carolleeae]|uniref:uncharacterized protein LOC111701049 n=1 Tax=Eurytemora carolleeae TaxID=1294199 RepID=UPI000C78D25F|nr:uncharacterized protein LOC111701049 [Eurytemora carolleeae]|eukprot:XP_023327933.1 uncharacterized protein LOC111701049 [Eurytemora affinis]